VTTDSPARVERYKRELGRLETLTDSVFAVVIVLIAFDIPRPEAIGAVDFGLFLKEQTLAIASSAIGLAVVLVYWFQSNALLGNLSRTDGRHSVFSVFQVFAVLTYLYTVGLGVDLDNITPVLALQSLAAALVGFMSASAWWYASKEKRLLATDVSDAEIGALRLRVLAEPLTAMFTFGLAFVGPAYWELGWLAYPIFAWLLRRTIFHER
jgi:uncharacterized membrane protein